MKINELLVIEQTVAPVGTTAPGGQTPMPTTPTTAPGVTSTSTNVAMGQDPKIGSQIKSSVTNLKDILKQAGGGNIDVAKLTQVMTQNDPNKPMNPQLQAAMKSMIPGLADAMQNQQAANQIKTGLDTGLKAQQAADLAKKQQQNQKIAQAPK
jgi:hypothetical protein